MKAVWSCVATINGALCAMTTGTTWMPLLPAGSLATLTQVHTGNNHLPDDL